MNNKEKKHFKVAKGCINLLLGISILVMFATFLGTFYLFFYSMEANLVWALVAAGFGSGIVILLFHGADALANASEYFGNKR